jgi:hypothetical protein
MNTPAGPVRTAGSHSAVQPLAPFILLLTVFGLLAACNAGTATDEPKSTTGSGRLGPEHLAVVINDEDPRSVATGEYYRTKRGIPASNIIHVRFKPGKNIIRLQAFQVLKAAVDGIDSNSYRPGAIAHHPTSAGGKLAGSKQMSSLRC